MQRCQKAPSKRGSCLTVHLQKLSSLQNPAQGAHHASSGLQSVAHALADYQIDIPAWHAMQHWPGDAAAAAMHQAGRSAPELKQTLCGHDSWPCNTLCSQCQQ